jgi:hypothetical protein
MASHTAAVAEARVARMPPCTVPGCDKHQRCRGVCQYHYNRLWRHGDPISGGTRAKNGEGTVNYHGYRLVHHEGKQRHEHIVVAERVLGKPLPPGAVVHHVDGDRLNNSPANLVICPDDAYHLLIHQRQRALDACGHANWIKCPYCKKHDDPKNLHISRNNRYHRACRNAARRRVHEKGATNV